MSDFLRHSVKAILLLQTDSTGELFAVYGLCSCPLPSQAIRNRVKTGVSGRRRSIDMVSSEYANFAPHSQHTR